MRLVESIYGRSMLLSLARGFKYFRNFHPDPRGNDPIWLVFSNGLKPPTRKNRVPLKRDHFHGKCHLPTINFQGFVSFSGGIFATTFATWLENKLSFQVLVAMWCAMFYKAFLVGGWWPPCRVARWRLLSRTVRIFVSWFFGPYWAPQVSSYTYKEGKLIGYNSTKILRWNSYCETAIYIGPWFL